MRCPKCGFISFDHLDFCRKCKKPLGSVAVMLHGSVYDCHAPVFLRFSRPEEEDEMGAPDDPLAHVIEEVEIEAPDLDAMRSPDPVPEQSTRASKPLTASVAAGNRATEAVAQMSTAATRTVSPPSTPQSAATFVADREVTSTPAWSEERPAALTLPQEEGIEFHPDLADISDLAPPERDVEFTEVEGGDDLDLNLDLDLGFDLQELQDMEGNTASLDLDAAPEPIATPRKSPSGPVDMDADLDFELDLGGLSLHDHDNNRK